MTNKNNNQIRKTISPLQPQSGVVQILPTTETRMDGVPAYIHHARATKHDSRYRQAVTLIQFDASANKAAHLNAAGPDIPSAQAPAQGLQPKSKESIENPENVLEKRTPQVVRQDKRRLGNARLRQSQPAADTKSTRAQGMYNRGVRTQNKSGIPQKNNRITLWGIDPLLKAELERIALRDGISLSAAGVAFLRRALQTDIDLEYTATLEPVIERVIARYLNNRDTRIISLLVRIAFDSGQTRSIVTNILGLQPDISPSLLRDILDESDKRAKTNITRKTPQVTELIDALNKWFFETNREESKLH